MTRAFITACHRAVSNTFGVIGYQLTVSVMRLRMSARQVVGVERKKREAWLGFLSVEFGAAFEGHFCFEVLEVAPNAGDGRDLLTRTEHDGSSFVF